MILSLIISRDKFTSFLFQGFFPVDQKTILLQQCCIYMDSARRYKIDRLGIISSGLCALHCALIPFLVSFGLIGSLSGDMHTTLEWTVLIFSVLLGLWSIYNAMQSHQKIWPQVLIGGGVLIILTGFIFLENHYLMAFGGLLLVTGHGSNWRLLGTTRS